MAGIMEAQIPLWLVMTVVAVALVVGATMIGVVLGKYAIHQWFHFVGGPVLAGFGVALIGLTVYGNVSLKAGEFELILGRVEAALKASETQNKELTQALAKTEEHLSAALDAVNSTTKYVKENHSLAHNRELLERVVFAQRTVNAVYEGLSPMVATR